MTAFFQAYNICPWRTAEAIFYGSIGVITALFLYYPFRAYVLLPLWAAWPWQARSRPEEPPTAAL